MSTSFDPREIQLYPLVLHIPPSQRMTRDEFFEFCQVNRKLRIERTAQGDIEIMPPTGGETGSRNATLTTLLGMWALQDNTGKHFDSSTAFDLPGGATYSPDASWIKKERLKAVSPKERKKFMPLCLDFVAELRSPSDKLKKIQRKMETYMADGAQLGWLLAPETRRVYVYRPGRHAECLENPATVSGDPVLAGFTLDVQKIWQSLDDE